jgi:hypothetical protein
LVPAHEVLMPMEMRVLEAAPIRASKPKKASAEQVPA